jgi:hypothetical protein
MNIKKSQLIGLIKEVVRKSLRDRALMESQNSKSSDVDLIVRLLIKKGIKDPEKIRQLASQLHLKQYNKPIDLDTLGQVIDRELGAPIAEIRDCSGLPDDQVPAWVRDSRERSRELARKRQQSQPTSTTSTSKTSKMSGVHTDKVDEASYKIVSPNQVDVSKEDKAREIQTDPEVNETAYKVQGRSYKTFDDAPKGDTNYKDDPENT